MPFRPVFDRTVVGLRISANTKKCYEALLIESILSLVVVLDQLKFLGN